MFDIIAVSSCGARSIFRISHYITSDGSSGKVSGFGLAIPRAFKTVQCADCRG